MNRAFSSCHPLVCFTWFVCVLLFTMVFMNPCFPALSFAAAFFTFFALKGRKAAPFNLLFALPMFAVVALLNPLFIHRGATALFYVNDRPVTLESVLYGIAASFMLFSVILWFACYNEVMTTDKFLYLFGRATPSLALLISMTLRLVPLLKNRITVISHAQKTIGMDMSGGNIKQRAEHGIRIFSILVTWSLESALETADSMKARGYGLKGRTSFSIYRFRARDAAVLAVTCACAALCAAGWFCGAVSFQFYPSLKWAPASPFTIVAPAAFGLLCFLPLTLEIREEIKWRLFPSKI